MKKLFIITSLFFGLIIYAQHNYDNQSVIYSHSNNKMTIGSNQIFGNYNINTTVLELNSTPSGIGLFQPPAAYFAAKTTNGTLHIGLNDTHNNGIFVSNNKPFVNYMTNVGEIMRFQTTGDVSIGTTISAHGYKLSVGGKIMTEGIRVQSVANWPDFVFNSNYSLSSLDDLEKYIKLNGHLPNIPSAKVVKEEGISLEEMSSKLLQKVEELTLYIIEINKENRKLKKEIDLLKKNNNLK